MNYYMKLFLHINSATMKESYSLKKNSFIRPTSKNMFVCCFPTKHFRAGLVGWKTVFCCCFLPKTCILEKHPHAVKLLQSLINTCQIFLKKAKNKNKIIG